MQYYLGDAAIMVDFMGMVGGYLEGDWMIFYCILEFLVNMDESMGNYNRE